MTLLHIDVETRSTIDLTKTGMYRYAEDPTTDLWVVCWSLDDGPIQRWYPHMDPPRFVERHVQRGYPIQAHNAMFEWCIWHYILGPRYGWTVPKHEQLYCTAAAAAAMALPRDLGRAVKAMGLPAEKDDVGRRLMLQMCKPRRYEGGMPVWWDLPEKIERLSQYCEDDVRAETALGKVLRPLSKDERELWLLDCAINMRGVRTDLKAVKDAEIITRKTLDRFNDHICRLTHNQVTAVTQNARITEWLNNNGVPTSTIAKAAVNDLLTDDKMPSRARQVLEIRLASAKTSTAKLNAYQRRTCADGRMRENLMYHGASTGRWAGKGAQLQNLPRGVFKPAEVEECIQNMRQRDPDIIDFQHVDPLTAVSSCLRGMLIPDKGNKFVCADFSNIEGRVLAWLAGEKWKLDAFRAYDAGEGPDLYKVAAAGIYSTTVEDIGSNRRQVGKTAELALGYQGGVMAFHTMAQGYGVNMAEPFPELWEQLDKEEQAEMDRRYQGWLDGALGDFEDHLGMSQDFVSEDIIQYRQKLRNAGLSEKDLPTLLSREVWLASEITKVMWRQKNPNIVQFWYDLEDAATRAVDNPGTIVKMPMGHIQFTSKRNVLWMRLPSGRLLAYMDPRIAEVTTPWGAKKQALTYMGMNSVTNKWTRLKSYGGHLAENATQAVARDILADAMKRVERAGYPVVLSVHDESLSEVPNGFGSVAEYEQIMSVLPTWARGLPVVAEGWEGHRYQK